MSCCTLLSKAITVILTCWLATFMVAPMELMVCQLILLQAVLGKLQEMILVFFKLLLCTKDVYMHVQSNYCATIYKN